jgi:hypothetical protein
MIQIAIRCQPTVPIDADELERWLELEVVDLRAEAPQCIVRLSRLTQGVSDAHLDIGWLIELQLPEEGPQLTRDRLAQALGDMRLLGLEPTLLAPLDVSDWSASGSAAISSEHPELGGRSNRFVRARSPRERRAGSGSMVEDVRALLSGR